MPTKDFNVAMYVSEVYNDPVSNPTTKLNLLVQAIQDAHQELHSATPNQLCLFLAPEYYFARKAGTSSSTDFSGQDVSLVGGVAADEAAKVRRKIYYTADEKDAIVKRIAQASTSCQGMLIVPGSILWRFDKKLPAFVYKPRATNSACIFLDGQEITRYDKHSDAGEMKGDPRLVSLFKKDYEDNYVFVQGVKSGVFTAGGVKLGIEICADHTNSTLEKECAATHSALDVHIIISAGMSVFQSKVCIKKTGTSFLTHNDGSRTPKSQTVRSWQGTPAKLTEIPPTKQTTDFKFWKGLQLDY
jgi:Carbon-nitrogen hydrolase